MPQLPAPDPRSADSRPEPLSKSRIRQDRGHVYHFRDAAAKGDFARPKPDRSGHRKEPTQ